MTGDPSGFGKDENNIDILDYEGRGEHDARFLDVSECGVCTKAADVSDVNFSGRLHVSPKRYLQHRQEGCTAIRFLSKTNLGAHRPL